MSWSQRLDAFLRQHANPPHKYGHQPRLVALVDQIAARTPELRFDADVVFAAAFLHDLGVFIGHRPEDPLSLSQWDHVAYACEQAPSILSHVGFPEHKLQHVLACIREHQHKDEPHSTEAVLLRDADILEQLGAVAVLRTASKLGSDTRFHLFTDALDALERALATLPPQLRLPASRELAESRIQALGAFVAALRAEAGTELH